MRCEPYFTCVNDARLFENYIKRLIFIISLHIVIRYITVFLASRIYVSPNPREPCSAL